VLLTALMENDDLHKAHKVGPHIVPGIWAYMFPEDFKYFNFPTARESTCGNCPKIVTDDFLPDTRCCTYNPRVPNYLFGLALERPDTKEAVRQVIKDGYATPEGMQQTPKQAKIALNQHIDDDFGKSKDVLCRFLNLESGLCQQYLYRNSVCASFFCVNNHGEAGGDFWERVQALAGQVESGLTQWAMNQNGLNTKEYFEKFDSYSSRLDESTSNDDDSWSKSFLRDVWAQWYGKEEEFYMACAESVRQEKSRLWEVACSTPILQPDKFEMSLYHTYSEDMAAQARSDGLVSGPPATYEDLWYVLQLAHRNIWCMPGPDIIVRLNTKVRLEENPMKTDVELHFSEKPYKIIREHLDEFIDSATYSFLTEFLTGRTVNHKWLNSLKGINAGETLSEMIGREVLVTSPPA
jgi:Fe-S-cluster containining protein